MSDQQGSKTARKTYSHTALAAGLALACWGSAALATNEPIPGVDIIVKKNPGGTIPVIVPIDTSSGRFSLQVKEPGNYTLSTACKQRGCAPGQLSINLPGAKRKIEADGSTSYEFTVKQGAPVKISGQVLSIALPKGAGAKGPAPSEDSNSALQGVSTTRKMYVPPAGGTIITDPPPTAPGTAGEPHVAAGDVNGDGYTATINWGDGSSPSTGPSPQKGGSPTPPGIADQGQTGVSTSYSTGTPPPKGGGDKTLPNSMGDPIPGTVVGLEHDPGGQRVGNTTTGTDGSFSFGNLPEGKYTLKVDGMPDQSVVVGNEGKIGGNLMKGSDGKMSIFDRWGNMVFRTAPKGEDKTPPNSMGDPIPGVDVMLGKNPGGSIAVITTDQHGAFNFDKLPEGKYILKVPGMPDQSVVVGNEGKIGGNLMKDSDGKMSIFDRWGNMVFRTVSPTAGGTQSQSGNKDSKNGPSGFGTGMNGSPGSGPGPAGMGAPPGMIPPGAGPTSGGPGPISPGGPGSPGGFGSPMRP